MRAVFFFSAFSFIYLYLFQGDVLGALHYSLSQGKTHYSPLAGAIIITLVLLIFRWGINGLLGLKGSVRSLSYFPSCLLLGVLTDVNRSLYHGGNFADKWLWLLPLLLIMYVGVVFVLRRIFRHWLDHESSVIGLINSNLAILLILCLMTACIGNSDINFHHELAIENAIREKDYKAARKVGYESLDQAVRLPCFGHMPCRVRERWASTCLSILNTTVRMVCCFLRLRRHTLRLDADSLYNYLGAKPYTAESTTDFLARICRDEVGKHTALDYYLSALLLDKKLDKFASVVEDSF